MGLSTTIVAPAPHEVPRDQSRSLVAMNSRIIQPAPDEVQRDLPPHARSRIGCRRGGSAARLGTAA